MFTAHDSRRGTRGQLLKGTGEVQLNEILESRRSLTGRKDELPRIAGLRHVVRNISCNNLGHAPPEQNKRNVPSDYAPFAIAGKRR
jgi:hypothetical protein